MGKYTDAFKRLAGTRTTTLPTAPEQTTLSRRFESLGLEPTTAVRPQALPDITDIETQRMQRDIRTQQPVIPTPVKPLVPQVEPTIVRRQGREFIAPKSEAVRAETLARLGATDIGRSILGITPEQAEEARLQTPIISQRPATTRTVADIGFLGDIGGQVVDIPEKIIRTGDISKRVGQIENITGMMLQYGGVSSALRPALEKIGMTGLKGFGIKQLSDLAVDNIVQLPNEILTAIREDKTIPQAAADIGKRNVVDMVFNAVVGIGDLRKAIREMKAVGDPVVDEAINQSFKTIQEELGLPKDMTAEQFMKDQEILAKELEIEDYYKQFEVEPPVAPSRVAPEIPRIEPEVPRVAPEIAPVREMAARIEQPPIPEPAVLRMAVEEPIDPTRLVLTEMPTTAKRDMVDMMDKAIQESTSRNIPFERIGGDVKVTASNLNRVAGDVEYQVVGKQANMQGEDIGKSVAEIFSNVPKDEKQNVFEYAFHKHNIDRFQQDKPVFGPTIDSDFSAGRIAELDSQNPLYAEVQKDITQYFNNLLNEWGVKSGLTSKETADLLGDLYKNYVPTYRAKDFPKNLAVTNQTVSQILKRAKGSEAQILPLDQQMIALTDKIVRNARRNEMLNHLATAFEEGKAGRYVTGIKGGEKEVFEDILDVGRSLDVEPVLKGNEFLVNFYKDGEPRQMVVNETVYNALKTIDTNEFAKNINKFITKPFKSLITEYNPLFTISNIIRDIPTALSYSSNPAKYVQNVPLAVKEMLNNGEAFRKFKAMGGTREGLIQSGKGFKVPTLEQQSGILKAVKDYNPISVIQNVNNFTETLPRFTEFLTVLQKTNDPALAVYKAAELTTDFSRYGTTSKLIDSTVPYFNASVQGLSTFARKLKESPLKVAASAGSVITVPTLVLDQMNKDNEAYNELSHRERNLYFNIPFEDEQGNTKFVRLSKSRELGVLFSSLAEWAMRYSRGQKVTGKEIAEAFSENFSPADVTSTVFTPTIKAWRQIKDPDSYQTNFWGGLIVPQSARKYSPGEQYDAKSSGISKAIGKEFGISPYVIDYWIKSNLGIIGQVVQPIGADITTSPLDIVSRKFINDPIFKSANINDFYDKMNEKNKEAQDFNRVNDVPSEVVTPLEDEANYLRRVSSELSDIRKLQRGIQLSDKFKEAQKEQRIRELQQQMNNIAKEAMEVVK